MEKLNMKDHYENACNDCSYDRTAKCVSCKRNSLYIDHYKKERKQYWASAQMSKELLSNMIGMKEDVEIRNIEFDVVRNTVRVHVVSTEPLDGMMQYVEGSAPPQVDMNKLMREDMQPDVPATKRLLDQIAGLSRGNA
jgi:hypothetical protein